MTPLFEIIYPENRIVVDYGDTRDLVLLAVIDHATGADLPLNTFDWPGPTVTTQKFDTFTALTDHVTEQHNETEEGYVVRFGAEAGGVPNLRLKLKFPGYVAAHRIATGLNSVTVWEAAAVAAAQTARLPRKRMVSSLQLAPKTIDGLLAHGDDPVERLRSSVGEEFLPWYDATVADLRAQEQRLYDQYVALTETARQQAPSGDSKAFALAAQQVAADHGVAVNPIYGLNQRRADVRVFLWTQIKPENREFASRDVSTAEG